MVGVIVGLGWLVGGLVLLAKKPPLILCSLRALTDGASSSVTVVVNVVDDDAMIMECEERIVVTRKLIVMIEKYG